MLVIAVDAVLLLYALAEPIPVLALKSLVPRQCRDDVRVLRYL